jgi:aryl-alcohol dehydrogenase-like predicted oxidoreductase
MSDHNHACSRRDFVKGGGLLLGGLAASAASARGADANPPAVLKVPDSVLGRTGARVSRLGIGCAYFQRKHVTADDVRAALHRALELGINYLDTAPTYGNAETGFAEEKMGPAISEIRDKVFLVTKTEEPSYDGTWKLIKQSLKRMRTDRLDLIHLHNLDR